MAAEDSGDEPEFVNVSPMDAIRRPDGRHLMVNTAPRGLSPWMGRGGDLGSFLIGLTGHLLVKDGRGYVLAVYRAPRFAGIPRTVAFAYASTPQVAAEIGARWLAACKAGQLDDVDKRIRWRERRRILSAG